MEEDGNNTRRCYWSRAVLALFFNSVWLYKVWIINGQFYFSEMSQLLLILRNHCIVNIIQSVEIEVTPLAPTNYPLELPKQTFHIA